MANVFPALLASPCRRLIPTLVAVALFALPGCSTLSEEEEEKLDNHRRNALTYLQTEEFLRAIQQSEMGLEIDENDYALLATRALARGYLAGDVYGRLVAAEPLFDDVYGLRSANEHQPLFLLEYAKVKQRVAAEQRRQAARAAEESNDPTLSNAIRSEKAGRATALSEESSSRSTAASDALLVLIERQELVRTANRVLMAIAAERGDGPGSIEYATKAIARLEEQKASLLNDIEKDLDLRRTLRAREALEDLIVEEKLIRSRLSAIYFQQELFAESVQQLDIILDLDPNRSFDYFNRAKAHQALGNRSKAVDDYQNFLSTTDLPASDDKVRQAYEYTQILP
ncbi:MAG: hypothetical protein AAF196_09135 [Planctomycetota bacterium]